MSLLDTGIQWEDYDLQSDAKAEHETAIRLPANEWDKTLDEIFAVLDLLPTRQSNQEGA